MTPTLTDESMREIVGRVAIDKEDVADVATDYLQEQGLL